MPVFGSSPPGLRSPPTPRRRGGKQSFARRVSKWVADALWRNCDTENEGLPGDPRRWAERACREL